MVPFGQIPFCLPNRVNTLFRTRVREGPLVGKGRNGSLVQISSLQEIAERRDLSSSVTTPLMVLSVPDHPENRSDLTAQLLGLGSGVHISARSVSCEDRCSAAPIAADPSRGGGTCGRTLYHNVSWPPDAEMVMMMAVTIRLPFLAMLSALVVPTVLIGGLALIRARNSGGESRGELVGETAPP